MIRFRFGDYFAKCRGVVAGCYQLKSSKPAIELNNFLEVEAPRLFPDTSVLEPRLEAHDDVEADVGSLLDYCLSSHELNCPSPWRDVLPLYPISPVEHY